ncbi:hypothetical protein FHS68_002436 [Dyadobacter arcticus]|uniref:DUF5668 domain-containing protein n=2 Tax=Dyadobacter arcticus TaxID=1078754 RepID=A0ABX0UJS3_9BACT|nr:hypothetical protein [Dyadobacter arcticus]
MNSKLNRTVLLALALGFFAVWVLEFRRAGLFESYWLLLLSIVCLLFFQFIRLKAATRNGVTEEKKIISPRKAPGKKPKR